MENVGQPTFDPDERRELRVLPDLSSRISVEFVVGSFEPKTAGLPSLQRVHSVRKRW